MAQALGFAGLWGAAMLWLARRIHGAACGREHARTGYALFGLALAGIALMALGVGASDDAARPLTAGERLLAVGLGLFVTASGWPAVWAYLRRAAECAD